MVEPDPVTVPSAGLHFTALSSRFVTARSRDAASPTTHHGSVSTSNVETGAAAADAVDGPVDDLGQVDLLEQHRSGSSRASSIEVTDQVRHLLDLRAHVLEQLRPGLGVQPALASAWRSRSRLVRNEVSGVRSSWPASATSRRCRSREADTRRASR